MDVPQVDGSLLPQRLRNPSLARALLDVKNGLKCFYCFEVSDSIVSDHDVLDGHIGLGLGLLWHLWIGR